MASVRVARGTLARWWRLGDRAAPVSPGEVEAVRSVFQWPGKSMPTAALTRQHDAGDAAGSAWLRADPAHVRADMATARMLACGELGLSLADCASISRELKPLFGDAGFEFDARLPQRWYVRASSGVQLPSAATPDEALGDDLKLHLPEGSAGKQWRQLFNEAQIILHNHPVNAERARIGAVAVNSLWFWGGGRLPDWVRSDLTLLISDRAELQSLADLASVTRAPLSTGIVSGIKQVEGSGRRVLIDLFELRADSLEENGFAVLDAMMRSGECSSVSLLFASGERLRFRPSHRLRFWRRTSDLA
ncbi:phosphoglycerate mutase [Dokdonella sp.]|uniref:phosphoglycerate mutase n=1 Tax=Dokdonella sp. TaxID=2291710 RepID=UPI003527696F